MSFNTKLVRIIICYGTKLLCNSFIVASVVVAIIGGSVKFVANLARFNDSCSKRSFS